MRKSFAKKRTPFDSRAFWMLGVIILLEVREWLFDLIKQAVLHIVSVFRRYERIFPSKLGRACCGVSHDPACKATIHSLFIKRHDDEHANGDACKDEGEKATRKSNRDGVYVFFHEISFLSRAREGKSLLLMEGCTGKRVEPRLT
jgi:hypothetical protein